MNKLCVFFSLFVISSVLLLAEAVRSKRASSSSKQTKNPYVLPGINKKKVAELKDGKTSWDVCWENESETHQVCLTRYDAKDYFSWITPVQEYLTWTNENIKFKVNMKKYKDGSIRQSWLSEDYGIFLFRGVKGNITQSWELPNTTWKYNKSADGEVSQQWEGEEDKTALKHYKSIIDKWCAVNYFYLGKENCIIY